MIKKISAIILVVLCFVIPCWAVTQFDTSNAGTGLTISNGPAGANTVVQGPSTAGWEMVRVKTPESTGKWWCEIIASAETSGGMMAGIATSSATLSNFLGYDAYGWSYYSTSGDTYHNNSPASYGTTWYKGGNIIDIGWDATDGTLIFYYNGTSQGTAFSSLSGSMFFAVSEYNIGDVAALNCGAVPFIYCPPAGYSGIDGNSCLSSGKYTNIFWPN